MFQGLIVKRSRKLRTALTWERNPSPFQASVISSSCRSRGNRLPTVCSRTIASGIAPRKPALALLDWRAPRRAGMPTSERRGGQQPAWAGHLVQGRASISKATSVAWDASRHRHIYTCFYNMSREKCTPIRFFRPSQITCGSGVGNCLTIFLALHKVIAQR